MENHIYNDDKTYVCATLEELPAIVEQIKSDLSASLILMIGDLGSGKTTFTKALLNSLDSADTGSSPSYSLINEYDISQGRFIHMDLYRLDTAEEVFRLGIEDYLYESTYCVIEWPHLIIDHLEPPYAVIKFEVKDQGIREITLAHIV